MKENNCVFSSKRSFPVIDFTEREIVHYMEVQKVSKDYNPEKPSEFLIEVSVEEFERIPIDDFVASFSSKVGLKNELKGVVSRQQLDAYIDEHMAKPGFVDLTKLPDSVLAMGEYAVRLDEIWKAIPDDLRKGMTKEEFLKNITPEKVDEYVRSQMPKKKDGE